jgi:hypothetical protein
MTFLGYVAGLFLGAAALYLAASLISGAIGPRF